MSAWREKTHEVLREVWARDMSADEAIDEIEDTVQVMAEALELRQQLRRAGILFCARKLLEKEEEACKQALRLYHGDES